MFALRVSTALGSILYSYVPSGPAATTFGALTLVGAGGVPTSETDGVYGEFTVSGGTLTGNTTPLTVGAATVGDTTVTVVADEYSVATQAEVNSAFNAESGVGGKTVRFRGVDVDMSTDARLGKNKTYPTRMLLTGEVGTRLHSGALRFENTNNITVEGLSIDGSGLAKNTSLINLTGACHNFIVQDNMLMGSPRDWFGDYTASGSYVNPNGIWSVKGSAPADTTGVIRRNLFVDMTQPISMKHRSGDGNGLSITDNEFRGSYTDCIKVTMEPGAETSPVDISRNVGWAFVGDPLDDDNPHIDFMQFGSTAANDGIVFENITITQNISWVDLTTSRGRGVQGIAAFEDGGYNIVIKNATVSGNVMLLDGNHHITFEAVDGGTFENNTLVSPSPTYPVTGQHGINTGDNSSVGTVTVRNNIVDRLTLQGSATYNQSNNIVSGLQGATVPYSTSFDGPFAPNTFDEAKVGFNVTDATTGSFGSDYGTYGNVRDESGWAINAPAYSQNLVDTNATAYLLKSGGFGGNETAMTLSMWINPQSLVGNDYLFEVGGRSSVFLQATGDLRVAIKDTTNSSRYDGTSSSVPLPVGSLAHVYVAVDMAGDTLDIRVNDVDVMGDTGSFTGGNGLIDLDNGMGLLSSVSGTASADVQISDLMLFNSIVPIATLYNGGTPPDPSTIGSPLVLLGSDMTADERAGNTAEGWNDNFNIGSGGNPTGGSATFTDV